jgi:hypothetical protein
MAALIIDIDLEVSRQDGRPARSLYMLMKRKNICYLMMRFVQAASPEDSLNLLSGVCLETEQSRLGVHLAA